MYRPMGSAAGFRGRFVDDSFFLQGGLFLYDEIKPLTWLRIHLGGRRARRRSAWSGSQAACEDHAERHGQTEENWIEDQSCLHTTPPVGWGRSMIGGARSIRKRASVAARRFGIS